MTWNRVMRYVYRSPVGTFWIAPGRDGRWTLGVDDEALGSYHSAAAAADDVYCQVTGHDLWDSLPTVDGPCDLGEWDPVR